MQKLITKLIIVLTVLSSLFLFSAPLASALNCANTQNLTAKEQIQCGACDASGTATCPAGDAPGTLSDTITTVVNLLSAAVGVIAVIMIIVGGLRFVTSAGNSEGTKNARNTITYAVIGLVVVALAQIIVHFVLSKTK